MNKSVLFFSHSIPSRLQYIADFFSQYYGLPFKLVSDPETYKNTDDACKINYSYQRLAPRELFIHPHSLLFETSIRQVKIECFECNGSPAFFKTEGDAGFDLPAAIFYLITRYEEYLPHQKDKYGRYAPENSVAFKEKFLQLPLVNIWLENFRQLLAQQNPAFEVSHSRFALLPTYDIDMAWSFRNKGFKRNLAGAALQLLTLKFRQLAKRVRVVRGKEDDPFDAYEWMDNLHKQCQVFPMYFFLLAKERSRYDKNIDSSNNEFQQLVRSISSQYDVGLHPSWASGDLPSLLKEEKEALEQIIGKKIFSSRQHYIRFDLPETYRQLLANGIGADHSMGYGSMNGFRAAITSPFYWYDLKNEEPTKLLVYPFCFMDANAYYEQQLTPEAALEELFHYYRVIRSVNGTMITVWHNSFLGNGKEFSGWKEIYRRFFEQCRLADLDSSSVHEVNTKQSDQHPRDNK